MRFNWLTRRRFLGTLGGGAFSTLAGCSADQSSQSTSSSTSTTVRFTDTRTVTTDAATTPIDTTEQTTTGTPRPETVVFDGGDAAAFKAALDTLAETPGATLEIDPGTYRFERPTYESNVPLSAHFVPIDLDDVTIEGNGATLVGTRPHLGMLHFLNGSNVTLRNLTIDYDPVPFTQGEIVDVLNEENAIILELDDGYPSLSNELFEVALGLSGNLHTKDGKLIGGIHHDGSPFKRFESFSHQNGRKWKVSFADPRNVQMDGVKRGRKLTIDARGSPQSGPAHAILASGIDDVLLENVTVRTCSNKAFVIKQCANPVIRNVTVAPPPNSNRLTTTTGDGVNVLNCTDAPIVEDSHFESVGDDAVVVNTKMTKVTARPDDRTIEVSDNSGIYIKSDDVLVGMKATGVRIGELPGISEIDYREEYLESWVPGRPKTITFEDSIADILEEGAYVSNTSKANADFEIRNNTVRESIANGIRVAAGPGIVEDNDINGVARHGVWLRCDTSGTFDAKRWSNDVTIRKNRIVRPGMAFFAGPQPEGIQAVYWPPDDVSVKGQPHRNLTFEDNEIVNGAHIGISTSDAQGVQIRSNEMRKLNQLSYSTAGYGIELDNVDTGSVTDNSVAGSSEYLTGFGIRRDSTGITARDNELCIDGESVPARLVSWSPIELTFDRVVEYPDRSLAIRVFHLSLFDESGTEFFSTNVGNSEEKVLFNKGVYDSEQDAEASWRWFGGQNGRSVVAFPERIVEKSASLELHAKAAESQVSATVSVGGTETDEVTFYKGNPRTYRLSLTTD